MPGIQLAHACRKASTYRPWSGKGEVPADKGGWQTIAPSAERFSSNYPLPTAMTHADIAEVILHFQEGTQRALKAGFQVIEIIEPFDEEPYR